MQFYLKHGLITGVMSVLIGVGAIHFTHFLSLVLKKMKKPETRVATEVSEKVLHGNGKIQEIM